MILVPDTFFSPADISMPAGGNKSHSTSLLVQCITDEFEGVPIEPVMRRYWNENAGDLGPYSSTKPIVIYHSILGLEFVNQLTIDDDERAATLVAVSNKSVYAHICTLYVNVLTCTRWWWRGALLEW